jgi:hypothetical protein
MQEYSYLIIIRTAIIVNLLDSTKRHLAAKPMLLPYPRMYVRRLFLRFTGFGGTATTFPYVKFSTKRLILGANDKDVI